MPDLVIRDFTQDELDALKKLAAPRSVQAWGKELLQSTIRAPVVHHRFILKAFGPGGAYVIIRRVDDQMSDPREGLKSLSEGQKHAYYEALEYVKRNAPGDREEAIASLREQFATVFETMME